MCPLRVLGKKKKVRASIRAEAAFQVALVTQQNLLFWCVTKAKHSRCGSR